MCFIAKTLSAKILRKNKLSAESSNFHKKENKYPEAV
jgi:hypothetical protein